MVVQKSRFCRFCRITPVLSDLQWLPVRHRISFKIATGAFKVLQFQQPSHLHSSHDMYRCKHFALLQPCLSVPPRKTTMATSKLVSSVASNIQNALLNHLLKKNDGTITQLINLTNKIYQGLDDENEVAVIFLDLSKADDRICHKHLLYKLRKIGVRGSLLKWFESYLSGRSQRVVYGGESSDFWTFGALYLKVQYFHHLFLIYLSS